jgi:hypothetical protein
MDSISFQQEVRYFLSTKNAIFRDGRFHRDFLWFADLAKHFVDYAEAYEEE